MDWEDLSSGVDTVWNATRAATRQVYEIDQTARNYVSDSIRSDQQSVHEGTRWFEDRFSEQVHSEAAQLADVPVLGTLAEGVADAETYGVEMGRRRDTGRD